MECKCGYDFTEAGRILDYGKNWFNVLGDEIECPECKTKYVVDYEENFNENTGEECGYWGLTEV